MIFKIKDNFGDLIGGYRKDLANSLLSLNSVRYRDPLYENHSNTEYISSGTLKKFISQNGIDFRGTEVNSVEDLAVLSKIFRDTRYETFRIIYVKDNKIVGNGGVTSRIPSNSAVFPTKKSSINSCDNQFRGWYGYDSKMQRLHADGYYLVHNHPSGDVQYSPEDMNISKLFAKNIDGFFGHLIIGEHSYGFIDSSFDFSIHDYADEEKSEQQVLNNHSQVASYVKTYNVSSNDYFIIIYLNTHNAIVGIEKAENKAIRSNKFIRYLYNQKRENGAYRLFIYTENSEIVDELSELLVVDDTITDVIYSNDNDVYSVRELNKLPISRYDKVVKGYKVKES